MADSIDNEPALPQNLRQALAASAAGDTDGALRLLRLAVDDEPTAALPQFLLGAELAQQGQMREAEAALANAVLLAPGFHAARFQLGLLQFTSGQAALALVTWTPLMELGESDYFCQFVRGFAHLAQDRFDDALASLQRGTELNLDNAPLNEDMRKLMTRIRQAQADAAAPQGEPDADLASHVLLANYQSGGPPN